MIATLAVIAFLIAAAIVEEKEGTSYAGACMIVFVFLSFVVSPIGVILLFFLKLLLFCTALDKCCFFFGM